MLVIDSEKRATSITLCNELNKTINIEYTDLSMEVNIISILNNLLKI